MKSEFGNKSFPVWMLSEMEISIWEQKLEGPFDYRLPMRHVICTSVFNKVQEKVYQLDRARVNTENFYIRNTLPTSLNKPNINDVIWDTAVLHELDSIKNCIQSYRPKIVFCFGAFTYESMRRIDEQQEERSYGSWTPGELGKAFAEQVNAFDINKVNYFPLLDRSISGWKFLESHDEFVGQANADYFGYVGQEIGKILIHHKQELGIWL